MLGRERCLWLTLSSHSPSLEKAKEGNRQTCYFTQHYLQPRNDFVANEEEGTREDGDRQAGSRLQAGRHTLSRQTGNREAGKQQAGSRQAEGQARGKVGGWAGRVSITFRSIWFQDKRKKFICVQSLCFYKHN